MMKEPLLKSVMTPFPWSVNINAPVGEARMLMLKHRIRHLPVTDENRLVGLISDRDIKLVLGPEIGSPDPADVSVEDAYTEDHYVVDITMPLRSVLEHMAEHHLGATVVTRKGRIAGIFTAVDAYRAFAQHLEDEFHPGESDPPDSA